MQRALKFAAASVTILLIALGIYFHAQLFRANSARADLRRRFAGDYSDVALEKLRDDVDIKRAVRELGSLKRRIEREKKGLDPADESVSSKLTLVLAAFNKCAKQTDLNIKTINISSSSITITGDTSGSSAGQVLYRTVKNNGLDIIKEGFEMKAGRWHFNVRVKPKDSQRSNR